MKVSYFKDTDTLYIEFRDSGVAESKDLDENTILDINARGNVCAITFEHARRVEPRGIWMMLDADAK